MPADLNTHHLMGLAISLALGMLIGIQRGWIHRKQEYGSRVAGVRTYSLVGLLGGISGILSETYGIWISGALLICLTLIMVTAYYSSQKVKNDLSITSLIGMLLTFTFGILATEGHWTMAACAAIITTLLLDNKDEIHSALAKLEEIELEAAIKLLLISVVMLSILPNEGYGPWKALNPYEIWWMVVLIASISFVGYFAVKIGGATRGLLFTGLFAGLSSSTALTMHFAKLAKDNYNHRFIIASGILAACGTMFPRVLFVCYLINAELGEMLLIPILVMTLCIYLPAIYVWHRYKAPINEQVDLKQNPLELSTALTFGAILSGIILLSYLLRDWFGSVGIYILAMLSGITDVDAITLTLARQSNDPSLLPEASLAILIAAATNSLVKASLAGVLSKSNLLSCVTLPMIIAVAAGISCQLALT